MRTSLIKLRYQLPKISSLTITTTTTSKLQSISYPNPTSPLNRPFTTTTTFKMSTGIPNQTPGQPANLGQKSSLEGGTTGTVGLTASEALASNDLGIESHDFVAAPGVQLNEKQRVLVGSVMDVSFGFLWFYVNLLNETHRNSSPVSHQNLF